MQRKQQIPNWLDIIIKKIDSLSMLNELKPIDFAEEGGMSDVIAKQLGDALKPTQLRKFFHTIKALGRDLATQKTWSEIEANFYLLKPQLAYASGRKLIPPEFNLLLKRVFRKVDVGTEQERRDNFQRLVQFLESIVAYHKYYTRR